MLEASSIIVRCYDDTFWGKKLRHSREIGTTSIERLKYHENENYKTKFFTSIFLLRARDQELNK